MNITIDKKPYTIKIGTRAIMSLNKEAAESGNFSFEDIVDLAMAGIKGDKPDREKLADLIDEDISVFTDLTNELEAVSVMIMEAKK